MLKVRTRSGTMFCLFSMCLPMVPVWAADMCLFVIFFSFFVLFVLFVFCFVCLLVMKAEYI